MKKFIPALLGILLFIPGLAQEGKINKEKFGEHLEGFIIKPDGKKMTGEFLYAHPVEMSKQVMFNGTIYQPDQLKEFFVDGNHWISVNENKKQQFAVCARYGAITVYQTLSYPEGVEYGDDNTPWETVTYQKKLDEERVATAGFLIGFKKKMSEYVSDYPEMAKKIEKKEKGYGMMNHYQIVDEYNAWYMEQNPDFAMAADAEVGAIIIPADAKTVDVSDEGDVNSVVGVLNSEVSDGGSATIVGAGKITDIGNTFNLRDGLFIAKDGTLTSTKPSIGVDGFVAGDWIVKIGVVTKNQVDPLDRDLIVNTIIIGQL